MPDLKQLSKTSPELAGMNAPDPAGGATNIARWRRDVAEPDGDELEEQLDGRARGLVDPAQAPQWLRPVLNRTLQGPLPGLSLRTALKKQSGNRQSAVLMLLAEGESGPDILLTQRASGMRTHSGQPAFPGGTLDPGEDSVMAALREGEEETGLVQSSVTPMVLMPRLYLPASEFVIQPVLAHWHTPGPVRAVSPAETASVARVPIADLASPDNRVQVRFRSYVGAGFQVAGMTVWGFTAALLDSLLDLGEWAQPWDHSRVIDLPASAG